MFHIQIPSFDRRKSIVIGWPLLTELLRFFYRVCIVIIEDNSRPISTYKYVFWNYRISEAAKNSLLIFFSPFKSCIYNFKKAILFLQNLSFLQLLEKYHTIFNIPNGLKLIAHYIFYCLSSFSNDGTS